MSEKLSHFDDAGHAHMVDVSAKAETRREAVASAFVELNEAVLAALPKNPKGNPLEVARFAGIQAAKKTSELIPMCHPLALSFVDVSAEVVAGGVAIRATAATVAGTGVEMEAMTAAAVAALAGITGVSSAAVSGAGLPFLSATLPEMLSATLSAIAARGVCEG